MRKVLFAILTMVVLAVVAGLWFFRVGSDVPPFPEDTPQVRDIAAVWTELGALCLASTRLEMNEIGLISHGDFLSPIMVISHRPDNPKAPRILVMAVVHGDEPAGLETISCMVRRLVEGKCLLADLAVDFVPIVNPWGYAFNKRQNRDGRDIDCDFAGWRTPEARALRGFLEGKSYNMVLVLAEDGGASGCYLHQYGRESRKAADRALAAMERAGDPLEPDGYKMLMPLHGGLVDVPMWGLWYMRLSDQLAAAHYCRLNISRTVYMVHTPSGADINLRTTWQLKAVQALVRGAFSHDMPAAAPKIAPAAQ